MNTSNIHYTTANTFCCPKNEIIIQEECEVFDKFTNTGASSTVYDVALPILTQSTSTTLFVDPTTTGNITLITNGQGESHTVVVQPGNSATVYTAKLGSVTITIPGGVTFTGKVCNKIYFRQPCP